MSTRPFRLIHSGDFHLERPLGGVAEVPDHLRDLFLEAPYAAARKVFDAVLAEDADCLLLAGGIIRPQDTGPRGPLFLVEQFARLAQRGIAVYWAGSQMDPPEAWPAALELPRNVHVFQQGRVQEVLLQRGGEPLARLAGTCASAHVPLRPDEFSPDPAGLYTIALVHGDAELSAMQSRGIHFWALGGRHNRSTLHCGEKGSPLVHCCGSPQGRCPDESGVHGCTLMQVDASQQTRTSLIPTDTVRYVNERLVVDESTSPEDFQERLRQHLHTLIESSPAAALLISWTVAGTGPIIAQLRRGRLAADVLQSLRTDYGYRSPPAWSLSIETEPVETLPAEWYEQETIRGDFLRAVRQLQMNPHEPLTLEAYVSETHLAGALSAAASVAEKPRERVLREAALLGVELLSGEEAQS